MAEHQQHPAASSLKQTIQEKGPSTSQVLAVITLFPLGGVLLFLAGITLAGTLIGLMVATPIFIICSPVLVPAALTIGLAVTGFLTSGAFGITALSSLSWIINYFRGMRPDQLEQAKKTGQAAQRPKDVAQRTQESVRT